MTSSRNDPSPLGIIGGSAFLEGAPEGGWELSSISTARGEVLLRVGPGFVFLRRHGEDGYRPPHRIPHHAHLLALEACGVREVVGLASVGALHPDLSPGDVVIPEDYLSRHPPPTFAKDEYLHIVPALDAKLRERLLGIATKVAGRERVVDGGVYGETRGPRFETRAEIRSLARDATLVGMTAASEATLCQERGMRYAMLCVVDNWANGVGRAPLTLEAFQEQQTRNRGLVQALVRELLGAGGGWGQEGGDSPNR